MAKSNDRIEFHPETIREIRESIRWCCERKEATAAEFRTLVQAAEEFIQ
jgi:hypothetical protein